MIPRSPPDSAAHASVSPSLRPEGSGLSCPSERTWSRRQWLGWGLLGGLLGGSLGCTPARRGPTAEPVSLLNKPTTSSQSVAMEFARVLVPGHRRRSLEELWRSSDQQAIDLNTRKRLIRNGLRVGVLGQVLPAPLRSLLQALPVAEDQLSDLQRQMHAAGLLKPEPVVQNHTRLSLKYDQARDLDVGLPQASLGWVWQGDHGRSHHRYTQATPRIRVTPRLATGGVLHLSVEPCVAHGPLVPQFSQALAAAPDDPFQPGVAQQEVLLPDVATTVALQLGETLLFGPSFDLQGRREESLMGDAFFQHSGPIPGDWLVLLRLIESKFDDLWVTS